MKAHNVILDVLVEGALKEGARWSWDMASRRLACEGGAAGGVEGGR